jgi:hypothetical protein
VAGLNLLRPSARGGQLSTPPNIEMFARAISQGYSFAPRSSCAACQEKLIDFESKCCGFCERCMGAIEAARNMVSA